ncbi:PGC1 (YPL206C) [Zygosaccharomyces parabailii]|nr:PGC1 (YPL206C) [Zygosaccharomyces parabailii]
MVLVAGHRAFKAQYIENTMVAFDRAYEAKADIIETDLQMTSDGVVVVNHDADTGRIWDQDLCISDHTFEEISKLRCKDDSTLRMPTLIDILKWMVDHPNVRLMLDIKFTNQKIVLPKTYAAMLGVKNDVQFWQKHIIWGLWQLDWFQYGVETGAIKDFEVFVITLSLDIAEQFIKYSLKLNNPHFKLSGISIHFVASWTQKFRYHLAPIFQENDIKVFLWTVNKGIDFKYTGGLPIAGVVTDDPIVARQLSNEYSSIKKFVPPSWGSLNGLRFYSFLAAYHIICTLLVIPWAHYKVGPYSVAYLVLYLLRTIHFL